jgi:hypothetical protein
MTTLHLAFWMGHTDIVRLLLDKGADTEAKDEVSTFRGVQVGYVTFLPTINLLYPCFTASSFSGCREGTCR